MSLFFLTLLMAGWVELAHAPQADFSSQLSAALEEESQTLLSKLGTKKEKDYLKSFLEGYEDLNAAVSRVVFSTGRNLISRRPELRKRVARESERGQVASFSQAPVVLYGNIQQDDVFQSWQEQLRANLTQISVILRNNPKEVIRHQWIWYEDYRKERRDFFCAVQIRDCLKEANKLARLLTSQPKLLRVTKDKILFEEGFSGNLSRWKKYGEGKAGTKDDSLYMQGSPLMVWTARKAFQGNCLVELDFTPAKGRGGVIFAFPGSPRAGLGYSVSAGREAPRSHVPPRNPDIMEPYNHGIDTYHVSVHRRRTHLRRAGSGLKMLNVLSADPCATPGRTYRVEILKVGETFQFLVDGILIHSYVDAGVYGPNLTEGQFGIRQFGKVNAHYDNVLVYRLNILEE